DAHETFDRRAVEHDVGVERLLELRCRHLHVLVHAEDVGELEAEESHFVGAGQLQNVFLGGACGVGNERSILRGHVASYVAWKMGEPLPRGSCAAMNVGGAAWWVQVSAPRRSRGHSAVVPGARL